MSALLDKLARECGYNAEAGDDDPEGGSVDALIGYKDALEDLIGRIDELALANSGAPDAEAWRDANDAGSISAADVTGGLFSMGFGEVPR